MLASHFSRRKRYGWLVLALGNALSFAAMPLAEAGPQSETTQASCFLPAVLNDGLRTAASSDVGFDSRALCAVLEAARGAADNVHSILVLRRGKLVAELYRSGTDRTIYALWASRVNFNAADQHDMRSISKSIVGLLYGILLQRGEVPPIDTPVASLYPEYPELANSSRRSIQIQHLLTMSSGLEWNEPSPVRRLATTDETGLFIRRCAYYYVFSRDIVASPGERFTYSGGATTVLAEIMERATKRSLQELAAAELFMPLGITEWQWTRNLRDAPMAAAGLRLKPRDLMKIGAMVLANGVWHGRSIVPATWVSQSTKPSIAADPIGAYGYQWWLLSARWSGKNQTVAAAIGNGWQRLFLVPERDLAVVMTAGDYGHPAISEPLFRILEHILAALPE